MPALLAALQVGVGCAAAKEVIDAVAKAVLDAKKHFVSVPLTRSFSFPHRIDGTPCFWAMLHQAASISGVGMHLLSLLPDQLLPSPMLMYPGTLSVHQAASISGWAYEEGSRVDVLRGPRHLASMPS